MKIEVWSDFVCPFCYIGKRHLEMALENYENRNEVEVIFKSFELSPNAKKKYEGNIHEIIAAKYGISLEQATANNNRIVAQAKSIGLNYNFDTLMPTNTFDAHRLLHFAKVKGNMDVLAEQIFKAYFVDSKDISNHEILATLALEVGMDKNEAIGVLNSGQFTDEVRADERLAHENNISSVPHFIINGQYVVSGAQPPEVFLKILRELK